MRLSLGEDKQQLSNAGSMLTQDAGTKADYK